MKNIKEPFILRELTKIPLEQVTSDILDYGGQSYLVLMDYFIKWLGATKLQDKTSKSVIKALKSVFSKFRFLLKVYAGNMPFKSQ